MRKAGRVYPTAFLHLFRIRNGIQSRRKAIPQAISQIVSRHPHYFITLPIVFLIIGWLAYSIIAPLLAASATKTITSQADWEAGEYYNGTVDTKSSAGDMSIKAGSVGTWDTGTPGFAVDTAGYDYWSYDGASYGAAMTTDDTYIYQIVGNRRPYLFRYNPETNTWKQLANAPTSFLYGASLTYDGNGNLYASDGGEQVLSTATGDVSAEKHFYKYTIATDTWSRLADAPATWGLGSSLAANRNGKIYAVRGVNQDTLWAYTIATNTWDVTLASLPSPYFVYTTNGQPLVFVNESYGDPAKCASGCLFTLYGNGNRQFLRYDIAENQWYYNSPTDLTIPAALGGAGYGSSFAYDTANGNLYLLHGNQQAYFSKYDVSAETWDAAAATTAEAPGPVYYGGASIYLNGYVYALKGYAVPDFWRYDVAGNVWNSISTPAAAGNAGEDGHMVFVPDATCPDAAAGDCLYVLRGANTNTFWRFNLTARTWTALSSTNLGNLQVGSSSCWNGADYLYALGGNGGYNFYRYSISGNAWTAMTTVPTTHTGAGAYPASPTTQVVSYGGRAACVGTNVYVSKGAANANGSNHFYLFDGTNWTQKTVLPQRSYVGAASVGVPNGASCADATGCVFALMGNLRGDFARYNTTADTWTALASLPSATNYTGSLTFDGSGNIYAMSGDYDRKFWRYNISGNSWTRVADLPARVGYANALAYDTVSNVIYAENGMSTYGIQRFTPTTNNYITAATWISATQDLSYVNAWEQLSATHPTPGSSSISFALRSSTDKVSWSAWETVVNGASGNSTTQDLSAITTPARRYVQIRVTLTSDGSNTPTLNDVTVTYTKDSTAPTNPTTSGWSSSAKTTTIASGSSYFYTNPYFELSGATDTSGSGVAGYYVAWTTASGFNPSSSEDYYQTGTTYRVNTDMTTSSPGPTYYLRVATKDNAGNVSSAATAFTYTYAGIAATSTTSWSAQAQFETAGTSSSNLNTAANSGTDMTLASVSPGTWMDLPATFGLAGNQTAYNDTSVAWNGGDVIFALRSGGQKNFYKYTISTKTWSALANIGSTASPTQGSAIVYVPTGSQCADSQGCVFALVGTASLELQRYNVQANTWTALNSLPAGATVGYGGSLVWGGNNFLYASRGNGSTDIYRYNISGNTWGGVAWSSADYAINYGGGLVFVPNGTFCSDASGCLFVMRGANSNLFWRVNISTKAWTYRTAPPSASSAKGGYGAAFVYNSGYVYVIPGYAATDFLRYDIANDLWTTLADLPATHYYGSAQGMIYDTSTDTIYAMRSYNEYSFISYDVTNNKWRNPTIPHGLTSNGFNYGGLAFDGTDTLYIARGGNLNDFYKYTISTQTWQRLENIPMRMYVGSDLLYISGALYALTGAPPYGEAATRFYSYNPVTDQWTRLADTPNTVSYGTKLVWDGVNTIYTARGGNTTTYYSYSISGNTWSTQASTVPGAVNNGGCAVRSGTAIYQVRATSTLNFYKCNLDTGAGTCTWISDGGIGDPANAPASPGVLTNGAACTLDSGNIFVPRGNTTNTDFLIYNIAGDSWTNRTLNNFYNDGRMEAGPNGILYGFRGYNTSTMDRYVQQSSTTSFQRVGTWTSEIKDLGSAYGFGGLTVTDATQANTALEYETRTCSNAGCASDPNDVNWSAWTAVSSKKTVGTADYYAVGSTPARYFQLRITFTSDRIYTPTVSDVAVSYYVDSTAPNNPTAPVSAWKTSGKVTSVTNDTWTNSLTPYFEWSGSDNTGGIGLSGFYVYFGTNVAKDPVTDASDATNLAYKSGTNFYNVAGNGTGGSWDAATQSSAALTDGTYYLRIKTNDNNGNITSSAVTAFTYKADTSKPSNPTGVSATPSGYSSTNSYTFSWTASSDTGSGVLQYCYKTGSSSDTCVSAGTACSGGTCTVSGLTAYQTRVNTFSVRALDAGGNYSNDYTSSSYYYAGTAPTAPNNLQVSPGSQNNNNTFSVSWNLPTTCLGQTPCDAGDILRYCYTINQAPSVTTCGTNYGGNATPSADGGWTTSSQSTNRLLPTFSAATQQGTNTVYVVAMDAIGNINYDNVASQTFTFTSTASGPPSGMQATDSSDRTTNRFSITLTWDQPTNLGAGVEKYKVYRCLVSGTNCDNPSAVNDPPTNYTLISTTTTLGYLDTGLDNTKTYSYFARAIGPGNVASGNSAVLAMKPEGKFKSAPAMSGLPSASVRIRSAVIQWLTLNDQDRDGNVIEHKATSFVQYGVTTGYGSETGTSDLVTSHAVTITDLIPNTTYHYRTKWVDVDGNIGYSSDATFTTLGAPSAPRNLTVSPTTNTSNRFAFAWDPPNDEGVTVAGYFYVVNTVPTKDNVQYTVQKTSGPFAAATRQGTNTFYVVAVDDVGNVNYANYASVDFEAHTDPPAPPLNVTITDSSDRNAKRYSITLTWDPPTATASGTPLEAASSVDSNGIQYTISRSADNGQSFTTIATLKSTGYLDTGLDSSKTYTYKVTANDSAGASSPATNPVAKKPEGRYTSPPSITEAPSVTPDSFSATVAWRTERVASSFIDFGLSADALTDEQGTADLVEAHSVKVTGLKASTTYYYKIKSIDVDQNVAYSDVGTFTTLEAPRVLNVKITDVRLQDALISWETNKDSTIVINYGTTANYGLSYTDTSGSYASKHTVKLESLKDGTLYHLRIGGQDRSGNSIVSDDYQFTTLTFPKISDITTKNKSQGQTEITWKSNVPTTSSVEYYGDTIPPKTQGNTSLVTDHTILLFGLEDATPYKFKVRGSDQFGYEAISTEQQFTTLEDTTPPELFGVKSESNTIGSGEESKIQIVVSWKTNEPTTSQVLYGVGVSGDVFTEQTEENAELVLDHLVVISDLAQAKTYHFQVVSRDKAGNKTKSSSYTVLTSRKRESFLQLVISNLENTFSWLGNVGKLTSGR